MSVRQEEVPEQRRVDQRLHNATHEARVAQVDLKWLNKIIRLRCCGKVMVIKFHSIAMTVKNWKKYCLHTHLQNSK